MVISRLAKEREKLDSAPSLRKPGSYVGKKSIPGHHGGPVQIVFRNDPSHHVAEFLDIITMVSASK